MEFHWLATHDPLTLLANRYLLLDRIEQAILRARRDEGLFALLFIDLNGFKQVNDLAGHDQGDRYLKLIARLLPEQVRTTDTVARFGGDEFVVLLNGINQVKDATLIAEKLAQVIHDQVDPLTHSVTAAIGISIFPHNGQDADSLLKAADQAMYLAKKSAIHFTLA
jgi:diguanylate cyclase (GGDEF)-like protein